MTLNLLPWIAENNHLWQMEQSKCHCHHYVIRTPVFGSHDLRNVNEPNPADNYVNLWVGVVQSICSYKFSRHLHVPHFSSRCTTVQLSHSTSGCDTPVTNLLCFLILFSFVTRLVKFRVKRGPLHPLTSRKRPSIQWEPKTKNKKTEVPCHNRCGRIKIPPCSKALSAEHRLKFCIPSPAMVTSPYK
jgi:hypothetical protein